jgi:hypothetical protein
VKAFAAYLTDLPMPEEVKTAEMDELFIFIGDKKKQNLHPNTCRSRNSLFSWVQGGQLVEVQCETNQENKTGTEDMLLTNE